MEQIQQVHICVVWKLLLSKCDDFGNVDLKDLKDKNIQSIKKI